MTIQENVLLVKLGLGAMAANKGDAFAEEFYMRTLNDVATIPCREFDIANVQLMREQLEDRRGIGPKSALQLLAQLGWFVSAQLVDSGTSPVVY